MKENCKVVLIISGMVVAVCLMCLFAVQSASNKAINLEEAVYTAASDIKVEEEARVGKVINLADCVKQYDKHESNTLKKLAENMSKGNEIEDVSTAIVAITYNYPELKSSENYQTLMKELTLIENTLAQHRKNYNSSITAYNRYIKKFPTRIFLNWTKYEAKEFERFDYHAPINASQNLFGGKAYEMD